ncbi:M1-specific T cell receptor beta chain [Lates calcarifer]|uniref:M1-specific T cell receptor beta chain n=1 Tax=Lates calcarifer TaxID=8187 RepID=UPI0021D7CD75|nr:M1-specific T cell receptor beta chain [Lates calcarifer]
MISAGLIKVSAALLCVVGLSDGNDVNQTPLLWSTESQSATMNCSHTKGSSYRQMYWYRQLPGETMKQIVYTTAYSPHEYQSGFSEDKFPAKKNDAETGSLTVKKLLHNDSGVYFCAVSEHSETGSNTNNGVHQTSRLLVERGQSAQMNCKHDLGGTYFEMCWYQQLPEENLKQIVSTVPYSEPDFGDFSQDKFSATKSEAESGSFTVKNVEPGDSGVYFCAVSSHTSQPAYFGQGTKLTLVKNSKYREKVLKVVRGSFSPCTVGLCQFFTCESALCSGNYPAYFGEGTKLTVLEDGVDVTPPTVKMFWPSSKECRNPENTRKKTLLCVATDFYPDHVRVFWQMNGENVTTGVATGNPVKQHDKKYRITSRLRVHADDWQDPENEFTCNVEFFTIDKGPIIISESIQSKEDLSPKESTREDYLKITQTAKLTYSVFIIKSFIYGAFVVFVVYKLKGSTGKY